MTENEFVKMIFNAKTQAEEVYQENRLKDWKPLIYETQLMSMESMFGNQETWDRINAWVRSEWDVIDDTYRIHEMNESWRKIREQLDESINKRMNMHYIAPQGRGKTRLGSLIEQQYRMAEDQKVPSVRGLGYKFDQTWIDETCHWTEGSQRPIHGESDKESDPTLTQWLQCRGICSRTLSCSLS
jgi:hypothetical protein